MKALWMGLSVCVLVGGLAVAAIGAYTGHQELKELGCLNVALGATLVVIRLHEGDFNHG